MNLEGIGNDGYCKNCESNHNCVNCSHMKYLFDSKKIDNIIKKEERSEKQKHFCGECGLEITGNYPLCKECYYKNKLNHNY